MYTDAAFRRDEMCQKLRVKFKVLDKEETTQGIYNEHLRDRYVSIAVVAYDWLPSILQSASAMQIFHKKPKNIYLFICLNFHNSHMVFSRSPTLSVEFKFSLGVGLP